MKRICVILLLALLLPGMLLGAGAALPEYYGESYYAELPAMVEKLSLFDRFYQFVDGIFDLRSIVYFLTVIGVFLFLTVQSLEKRRWSE